MSRNNNAASSLSPPKPLSVDSDADVEKQTAIGIHQIDIHNAGRGVGLVPMVKRRKALVVVRQGLYGQDKAVIPLGHKDVVFRGGNHCPLVHITLPVGGASEFNDPTLAVQLHGMEVVVIASGAGFIFVDSGEPFAGIEII